MIFQEVILHDFSKPLAVRKESRKVVGPYRWTPSEPGKGRGFYTAQHSATECAKHGAGFRLRLSLANDHLQGSRLSQTYGYYIDSHQDETIEPIVATLNHRRGFLIGWTMGAGMCAALDTTTLYTDLEDAARAAHSMADHEAENMRDNEETENDA